MIPKITQQGPNIMERYWCGKCGAGLPDPHRASGKEPEQAWHFCPICGEPIEYDKAEPVQWAEQSCERCGCKLVMEIQNTPRSYFIATSDYVGGPICRSCLEEHCVQTNCLQCELATWPDCPYAWVKKLALDTEDISTGNLKETGGTSK